MEGIYLIHPRELIKLNKEIYKIGRSFDLDTRVKTYPRGSQIIFLFSCKNSVVYEKILINIFKNKFKQSRYYGSEYFEGSKDLMLKIMLEFIYKNLINDINTNNNNLALNNLIKDNIVNNFVDDKEENINDLAIDTNIIFNDVINNQIISDVVVNNEEINNIIVNTEAINNEAISDIVVSNSIYNKNNDRTCPTCKYIFPYPSRLKQHFKISTHCKKTNEDIDLFITTINNNTDTNNNTLHKCMKCNNTYINKYTLKKHQSISKCGVSNTQIKEKIINEEDKLLQEEAKNIKHIYPFGYEKIPNISKEEMKKILLSGEKGLVDIITLIYEQDENKNFYKINMNHKNISYLSDNYTLRICQENELKDILYNKCIYFSNYILLNCKDILSKKELLFVNNNHKNISDIVKEELYNNYVKKILYIQLRYNSKTINKNIDNYITIINNNPIVKQKAMHNLKEEKDIIDKYNNN